MEKHFTDLLAWKISREFTKLLYQVSQPFPKEERYGLTSQIRRASVSIPTNIAEGYGRYYFKEKARFYTIARGSAFEVESLLHLSCDLGYIDLQQFKTLHPICIRIQKLCSGLISSNRNRA